MPKLPSVNFANKKHEIAKHEIVTSGPLLLEEPSSPQILSPSDDVPSTSSVSFDTPESVNRDKVLIQRPAQIATPFPKKMKLSGAQAPTKPLGKFRPPYQRVTAWTPPVKNIGLRPAPTKLPSDGILFESDSNPTQDSSKVERQVVVAGDDPPMTPPATTLPLRSTPFETRAFIIYSDDILHEIQRKELSISDFTRILEKHKNKQSFSSEYNV
uniref:Extensin-like n=1 Tax=Caenorhabditis tropicalis TaxID=1561998 RepID=A0A1I7SXX3_9PELO